MADCHSIPTHRDCTKCGQTKNLEFFSNAARGRYGKNSVCKECVRAYMVANKDRINALSLEKYHKAQAPKKVAKQAAREARMASTEKACARCKTVKSKAEFKRKKDAADGHHCHCRDCCNAINREHRERNPEMAAAWSRRWAKKNPEKVRAKSLRWIEKNPGRQSELSRNWVERNKERHRENMVRYMSIPRVRLHRTIRERIRQMLKGNKSKKTLEILGYDIATLKGHLERQFSKGMNWSNYGDWHVDHIVPLSSFNITSEFDPELQAAWALSNLRPLWATENLQKRAKRLFLI
jgi:hypothetical protein